MTPAKMFFICLAYTLFNLFLMMLCFKLNFGLDEFIFCCCFVVGCFVTGRALERWRNE